MNNQNRKSNACYEQKGTKKIKAFTLIELIIVMAVIGILTLLAVPKLMGYTQEARYTKLISTSKELERASERYFMDHEDWPRLTDDAYSAEEIHTFAEKIYDITGKEVTLDPAGNYYDIDYNKLSQYVKIPDDKMNYVLRNPVGKVYALEGLTEIAKDRNFAFNDINILISKSNPTTQDILTWSYETDGEVTEEEWQLDDGVITNTSPNGALSQGPHILRLRLKIENKWTKWNQYEFQVSRIPETFVVNAANSTVIDSDIEYDINDALSFNYTDSDTLIWTVPTSGLYKVDAIAAGAGGKGARIQGEIELKSGDILNLKIHSQNNGGGARGAYGNSTSGSGGTVIKVNNNMLIAAGGAGGHGATSELAYPGTGAGGKGGDGGDLESSCSGGDGINAVGRTGTNGSLSNGIIGSRGTGATSFSMGGNRGLRSNSTHANGYAGGNGLTIYDGGGGGGRANGNSYWIGGPGGGGAGGKSFADDSKVINTDITPGYNSGNGKVILTLISK